MTQYQVSYITYDADGLIKNVGISDPNSLAMLASNLPDGVVGVATVDNEVSEAIQQECYYDLDSNIITLFPTKPAGECYWDGSLKQFVTMPAQPSSYHEKSADGKSWIVSRGIEECKALMAAEINNAISQQRNQYLTNIPGQVMVYTSKYNEASKFIADMTDPLPVGWELDFPFIASEMGIYNNDPWQVAQTFLNMSAITNAALAELEETRQEGLHMVAACSDHVSLDAVKSWLLPSGP